MTDAYHITHITNLPGIIARGLLSDAARNTGTFAATNIGHLHIKQRRLLRVVPTPPGGHLGDYVPFNFCPRSVMLYVVSRGHPAYSGGQDDVLHLVADVAALTACGNAWCFTDRHAELAHAGYYTDLNAVPSLAWSSIQTSSWGGAARSQIKEEKQAEFLVHRGVPWTAIREIAAIDDTRAAQVRGILVGTPPPHPGVVVRRNWYY